MIEGITDLVSLKTVTEIVKNLLSLVQSAPSKDVPSDFVDSLNTEMGKLQRELLSAYTAQTALVDRVHELKDELLKHETWAAEKKHYGLKELPSGGFAYSLNDAEQTGEPAHYVCANCYEDRVKSILQPKRKGFACPRCENVTPGHNVLPPPRFL